MNLQSIILLAFLLLVAIYAAFHYFGRSGRGRGNNCDGNCGGCCGGC